VVLRASSEELLSAASRNKDLSIYCAAGVYSPHSLVMIGAESFSAT